MAALKALFSQHSKVPPRPKQTWPYLNWQTRWINFFPIPIDTANDGSSLWVLLSLAQLIYFYILAQLMRLYDLAQLVYFHHLAQLIYFLNLAQLMYLFNLAQLMHLL